jgi:hypothetical protein
MNIYKTQSGIYINMDMVIYIEPIRDSTDAEINMVEINMPEDTTLVLEGDEASSFLDYLDLHLQGVWSA